MYPHIVHAPSALNSCAHTIFALHTLHFPVPLEVCSTVFTYPQLLHLSSCVLETLLIYVTLLCSHATPHVVHVPVAAVLSYLCLVHTTSSLPSASTSKIISGLCFNFSLHAVHFPVVSKTCSSVCTYPQLLHVAL